MTGGVSESASCPRVETMLLRAKLCIRNFVKIQFFMFCKKKLCPIFKNIEILLFGSLPFTILLELERKVSTNMSRSHSRVPRVKTRKYRNHT